MCPVTSSWAIVLLSPASSVARALICVTESETAPSSRERMSVKRAYVLRIDPASDCAAATAPRRNAALSGCPATAVNALPKEVKDDATLLPSSDP